MRGIQYAAALVETIPPPAARWNTWTVRRKRER